jgi:hypothetical protein
MKFSKISDVQSVTVPSKESATCIFDHANGQKLSVALRVLSEVVPTQICGCIMFCECLDNFRFAFRKSRTIISVRTQKITRHIINFSAIR